MNASINLNDTIWVCLNDYGWEIIDKYYRNLYSISPLTEGHVDESIMIHKNHTKPHYIDGDHRLLTEFQLHEFMNIFGAKSYCGAQNYIENNKVYLTID